MVNKSTCYICGKMVDRDLTIRVSRSRKNNAIFFAAMKIYHSVESDLLYMFFESCNESQKTICVAHYLSIANNLLDDIAMGGGKLSRTTEDVAYLNDGDIPSQLLATLNTAITSFAVDITVNARDLCRYLNDYLKKYFRENEWQTDVVSRAQAEMEGNPPSNYNASEERSTELQDVSMPPPPPVMHVDSDSLRTPTPSVKHADSGTSKATSSSYHPSPEKLAALSDSDDEAPRKETKAGVLDKFYLVSGHKLLELFLLSRCGCQNSTDGVWLENCGSAPIIYYTNPGSKSGIERWEGQERLGPTIQEKMFTGNMLCCASAITTGVRMNKVRQWADEAGIVVPSKSTFYPIFTDMRQAVSTVYEAHQNAVIRFIKSEYERDGQSTWDIQVDGSFDSRGHSAAICKVLAIDQKTKLCVHTEVLHYSETDHNSVRMEKEGFKRLLSWFRSKNIGIRSISTDRSATYGSEIRAFNSENATNIMWLLDTWHMAKRLSAKIRAATKRRDCACLKEWISPLKAHLYYAARQGASAETPELTRQVFNTCLYHVADCHSWNQDADMGPLTNCAHEALEEDGKDKPVIPVGSTAHNQLKSIILQREFQDDLTHTSPFGGTSWCESKNSLDRLYCPKELCLPIGTYPSYVQMSTLHMNELRMAEIRGERGVARICTITRKFSDRPSAMTIKTPVPHTWRNEILTEFIYQRAGPSVPTQSASEEDMET